MGLSSAAVFPLLLIVPTPEGPRCECGDAACTRVGKHPAYPWGELGPGEKIRGADGCGYGIATGKRSGFFVVDLDGLDAQAAWAALNGGVAAADADTFVVRTGREGGLQLYWAYPDWFVKTTRGELWHNGLKGADAQGIDTRGDGGYVVAPGSPHKSGRTYEILRDVDPAPAPAWLLEWLRSKMVGADGPATAQSYPGDVEGPERDYRRGLYVDYLKQAPPCIQGQGGDQRLFEVVQHGAYDLQLPTADVLELVATHFDPKCEPPWGGELVERVTHKAHSAKTTSTRPRAEPLPRDLRHLVLEPPPKPPPPPAKKDDSVDADGMFWDAWDIPVKPPEYLVEGLIPIETVGMLVAHGSSLKTWTALDMGRAIATGRPWLDRFPTRKGRVLVVDYESGLYELRRRIWLLERGKVPGLGAWPYPDLRIDDPKMWERLASLKDIGLVVIDSLAAGAPGVDENDARVASPLKMAARWSNETKASVMFIHHSKKDDGDDRKMVRGSTAIYADCDWAYKFEQVDETSAYRRMHMVNIKPSMGKKPMPVPIELTDEGLFYFESSDAKPTRDASPDEIQSAIRLALSNGPIPTKDKIAAAIGVREQKVTPEIKALEVLKRIKLIKGVGYCLDGPNERAQRIIKVVSGYAYWRSEAQIAKAAYVDTADVEAVIAAGIVVRSAEGRYLVSA